MLDLSVELCFLRAQQWKDLKTREREKGGGVVEGNGGATYHLMLPLLHNPSLSNGGENADEAAEQNNGRQKEKGREGGSERGETALFFGVSM